jgi:Flp pilus assembly pilin Flp
MKHLRHFFLSLQKQNGQALPEYATTLALVTLFCIAALAVLGNGISSQLLDFANYIMSNITGGG